MRRPGMVSHSESSLNAISRMSPPHAGHSSRNSSSTRSMSLAQAIREVSWKRGLSAESRQPPAACPPSARPQPYAAFRYCQSRVP